MLGGFAYVAYRFVIVRGLEGRSDPTEIVFRGRLVAAGLALGAVLFGLVLGAVAVGGDVAIIQLLPWLPAAAGALAVGLGPALIEELFYRGIVVRRLQDWLGTWVALATSAAIFGLLHAANPGASVWSVVGVMIAGVTFGALYVWSGSLWLPIGAHLAWNTLLGFFGVPVSGSTPAGPLSTTLAGPPLLTGDTSGIETSVVTALVWGAVAVLALVLAARADRIVPPRRRRAPSA